MIRTLKTLVGATILATLAAGSATLAKDLPPGHSRCTAEQGQQYIDLGRYDKAIREFSCVIENDPTGVEGYRGRIEAALLLGLYSDALRDNASITANVSYPNARDTIFANYAASLAIDP